MVDIKELMRTYVFINDPNVKEITTKFGALLVAIAGIAAIVWVGVGMADDADPNQDPAAADADAGYTNEDCMPETQLNAWKQDHRDTVLSGDYEVRQVDTGVVCVDY